MMMMMMRGQKPWLILSSEMGKVQSIFFVCLLFVNQIKTHKPSLQACCFFLEVFSSSNQFILAVAFCCNFYFLSFSLYNWKLGVA